MLVDIKQNNLEKEIKSYTSRQILSISLTYITNTLFFKSSHIQSIFRGKGRSVGKWHKVRACIISVILNKKVI